MNNQDHILGFQSYKELLCTTFCNFKKYNMKNIFLTSLLLATFSEVIEIWLWSPAWTLILFWLVFTLDFFSAVAVSISAEKKDKDVDVKGFNTRKATKFIISIIAATCVLVILHMLGKALTEYEFHKQIVFAFEYMAITVYWMWLLFSFTSSLKHLSELGVVPTPIAKFIIKYIDNHKNKLNYKK